MAVLVPVYLRCGVKVRAWWLPVLFLKTGLESLPQHSIETLLSDPSLAHGLLPWSQQAHPVTAHVIH